MPAIRLPASHAYTLRLTRSGWTWEYLRRNEDYQEAWRLERRADLREPGRPAGAPARTPMDRAAPWGLMLLEPPDLTGLEAVPFWRADAIPARVRVGARPGAARRGAFFDLFAEPGNKAVCLTPEGAYTVIEIGGEGYRLLFADPAELRDQLPVEVRFGDMASDEPEREAALRFVHRDPSGEPRRRFVPSNAVHLMRQLQALDAHLAGAADLRAVAEAVYGPEVVAERWADPDGTLRRRVGYALARGKALMNGGYRTLLRTLRSKP